MAHNVKAFDPFISRLGSVLQVLDHMMMNDVDDMTPRDYKIELIYMLRTLIFQRPIHFQTARRRDPKIGKQI